MQIDSSRLSRTQHFQETDSQNTSIGSLSHVVELGHKINCSYCTTKNLSHSGEKLSSFKFVFKKGKQ